MTTCRTPRSRTRVVRAALLVGAVALVAACDPPLPPQPTRSQLGIFIPFVGNGISNTNAQIEGEANALHVKVLRAGDADLTTPSTRIEQLSGDGFQVVLTIRNHPPPGPVGGVTPPITTDAQAEQFRSELDAYLNRYRPTLLMVENEQLNISYFSGTASEYLRELNIAVEVAHHHGIPVTDGGITRPPLALMTWDDLRSRGLQDQADDYARRVFGEPQDHGILVDLLRKPFTGITNDRLRTAWEQAKVLVPGLRNSAVDYADFHWYGVDATSLGQSIAYLKAATGKPVVTTEIGQHTEDPAGVQSFLETVTAARLPYVIWFDLDGDPAVALHNPDYTLRPSGTTFARFAAAWAP